MKAKRRRLEHTKSYADDGNALTYSPEADGRNPNAESIRYLPLEAIRPSPRQTRLIHDESSDLRLASDINANGLIHVPMVRDDPCIAGAYEIVAGHRRVAALRLLGDEGLGTRVLRYDDSSSSPKIPCVLATLCDLEANTRTISENLMRDDLRPWEQARALQAHRAVMKASGNSASLRAIATAVESNHQTIAPYLQAASALTDDVLLSAGVASVSAGEVTIEHNRLCELSLATLVTIAQAKFPDRAGALRRELERKAAQTRNPSDARNAGKKRGFQMNIRKPLSELDDASRGNYLDRLAPAMLNLLPEEGRFAHIDSDRGEMIAFRYPRNPGQVKDVLEQLEAVAERVRAAWEP